MGDQPADVAFMSGWRVAAANVLSGSVVVIALSSALCAGTGAEVAAPRADAGPLGVQLGTAPVVVDWPHPHGHVLLELDATSLSGRAAVLEGLPEGAGVQACSTSWTASGQCPGAQAPLEADGSARSLRVPLEDGRAHLKVTDSYAGGSPAGLRIRTA